jgi:hypothetical protein
MLRRWGLLAALTSLLAAGCSIDRVEWESSGFPVEEVAHALEEEHGVEGASVQCIQREVQGADWECRAETAEGAYHCHAKANWPRERIRRIHCEAHHEEGEEHAPGEDEGETATTEHEEPAAGSEPETAEEH